MHPAGTREIRIRAWACLTAIYITYGVGTGRVEGALASKAEVCSGARTVLVVASGGAEAKVSERAAAAGAGPSSSSSAARTTAAAAGTLELGDPVGAGGGRGRVSQPKKTGAGSDEN